VLQTVPLGAQWPTLDPFLFCAHHLDRYPNSNGALGPDASLAGRSIGQDFAGKDGWNMYHGSSVPGFPQHPHRGFETVTYVRRGWCDHSDSLGAQARFGEGDMQWLTAGAGILHSEMLPLLDPDGPNTLHLFQIWLNLPAADKMVDPYFSMYWRDDLPKVAGEGTEVTVIAGVLDGNAPPPPPPDSWASKPDSQVAIWHLRSDPHAQLQLPQIEATADPKVTRVVYVFDGDLKVNNAEFIGTNTGAILDSSMSTELQAGAHGCEALVLQGRPIGEPVAQYGPFVLNDEDGVRQAMADYQRTQFGGWPWPSNDPNHGPSADRFVKHPE